MSILQGTPSNTLKSQVRHNVVFDPRSIAGHLPNQPWIFQTMTSETILLHRGLPRSSALKGNGIRDLQIPSCFLTGPFHSFAFSD